VADRHLYGHLNPLSGFLCRKCWLGCGRLSDCEELVGEVNHTTECVTDLFSFVDMDNSVIYFKLLVS